MFIKKNAYFNSMKRDKLNLVLVFSIIFGLGLFSFLLDANYNSISGLTIYNSTYGEPLEILLLIGDKVDSISDIIRLEFDNDTILNAEVIDLFDLDLEKNNNGIDYFEKPETFDLRSSIVGNAMLFPEFNLTLNITAYKINQENSTIYNYSYFMNISYNVTNQIVQEINLTNQTTNQSYLANQTINQTSTETIFEQINQSAYELIQSNSLNTLFNQSFIESINNIETSSTNSSTINTTKSMEKNSTLLEFQSNQNNTIIDLESLFNNSKYDHYNYSIIEFETDQRNFIIRNDLKVGFNQIEYEPYEGNGINLLGSQLNISPIFNQTAKFYLDNDVHQITSKHLNPIENSISIFNLSGKTNTELKTIYQNFEVINVTAEFEFIESQNFDLNVTRENIDTFVLTAIKDELYFDFSNLTIDLSKIDYEADVDNLDIRKLNLTIVSGNNTTNFAYDVNISTSCLENWVCNATDRCSVDGNRNNACVDTNECGTTFTKPASKIDCVYSCTQNFECTQFGGCTELGLKRRTCVDLNHCSDHDPNVTTIIVKDKPADFATCFNGCEEKWICDAWSSCTNGKERRICSEVNSCGSEILKPIEERNCGEQTNETHLKYYDLFVKSSSYQNLAINGIPQVIQESQNNNQNNVASNSNSETKQQEITQNNVVSNQKELETDNESEQNIAAVKNKEADNSISSAKTKNEKAVTGFSIAQEPESSPNYAGVLGILSLFIVSLFSFNQRQYIKEFSTSQDKKTYFRNYMDNKREDINNFVQKIRKKHFSRKNRKAMKENSAENNSNNINYPTPNSDLIEKNNRFVENHYENYSEVTMPASNTTPQADYSDISSYINYCRSNGFDDSQIYSALKSVGHSDYKIAKYFEGNTQQNMNRFQSIRQNLISSNEGIYFKRNFDFTKKMIMNNVSEQSIILSLQKRGLSEQDALEVIDKARDHLGFFK